MTCFPQHPPARPSFRLAGLCLCLTLATAQIACDRPERVSTEAPPLPVRLEAVSAAPFQPTLQLLGVVEPSYSVAVNAPIDGEVQYPESFSAGLRSGIEVSRGQVLAWQRARSAEHQEEVARLTAESAEGELERHREAWEQGLESDATYETYKLRAELARRQLDAIRQEREMLILKAPVSGRLKVANRYPPGARVDAGATLAEILADGRQVRGWAGTRDRERLSLGQAVDIRRPGGEVLARGAIEEIAPMAQRGGAYAVVAQPAGEGALPPPGEGVEMKVYLEPRQRALTIPGEAVVITADGASVFVAVRSRGELRAERRSVTLGERTGDDRSGQRIEVLHGLRRGDRVVSEGAALLSDGTGIVAVEDGATDPAPGGEAAPEDGSGDDNAREGAASDGGSGG